MASYTPLGVVTPSATSLPVWTPLQYSPQPTSDMFGGTMGTTSKERELYGTLDSDPSMQKRLLESPNLEYPPLRDSTRPPLSQRRNRRSSWWRAIVNRSRRFARITYTTGLILVLTLWVIVNLLFATRQHEHQMNLSIGDLKAQRARLQQFTDTALFLKGHLRAFDPQKSALTVEWEGLLVDVTQDAVDPVKDDLHLGTPQFRANWAVFRDVSTEEDIETENIVKAKYPNNTDYQFRVYPPAPPPVGYLGRSPEDSFSTDITLGQRDGSGVFRQPNFAYPYDVSEGKITFAVSTNDTMNELKTPPGTFLLTIAGAVLTETILNYKIDITNNATCLDESVEAGCQLDITLTLSRSGLVQFIVILTVVINWLITLAICVLAGEAIILRRAHILKGADILSICLTALFALPSVRSVLPGAPPFGCLVDLVGILPNLILISTCTTAFAVSKARNHLREDIRPPKDTN